MFQENEHPASEVNLEPFGRGSGYRSFGLLALLGMVYGIVVASVLSTSPTAIAVVTYVAPVFGVVGIVAGAWYGFFFNISNHCTGGRLLCGIIGGLGAAVVGTLAVSLLTAIVGTVAGFAAGWIVGSFLRDERQGKPLLISSGAGAVIQAGWADPAAVAQSASLGGVLGAIAGPAFLLLCVGLGYVVLRRIGSPRRPFDG